LTRIEAELGAADVIAELVTFIRQSIRGINRMRDRRLGAAAEPAAVEFSLAPAASRKVFRTRSCNLPAGLK
jgi:hypothetical protein